METEFNYTITFIGTPKDVSLKHTIPKPIIDEKGVSHPVTGTYTDERLKTSSLLRSSGNKEF